MLETFVGCFFFFFFKQKTAYEMRISDWSSDVCSSDLQGGEVVDGGAAVGDLEGGGGHVPGPCRVVPEPGDGIGDGVRLGIHDQCGLGALHELDQPAPVRADHHGTAVGEGLEHGEDVVIAERTEEHQSELQVRMRRSYAVTCLQT